MTRNVQALRFGLMAKDLAAKELALQIGARIRARRLEMGFKTQRALAEKLDNPATSNQHVSNWERGIYKPNDRNLADLAQVLEVDIAYFMGKGSEPNKRPILNVLNGNSENASEHPLEAIRDELQRIRERLDQLEVTRADPKLLKAIETLTELLARSARGTGGRRGGRKEPPDEGRQAG